MVTVVLLLVNNNNVISYHNNLLDLPKTLVKPVLKHISCNSCSKRHHCISKSSGAGANSLSYNHNTHNTCIHKKTSYVFRCLEMIWFPHNHFVQICRTQGDSKLQISRLIFPFNKHKAVYHGLPHELALKLPLSASYQFPA